MLVIYYLLLGVLWAAFANFIFSVLPGDKFTKTHWITLILFWPIDMTATILIIVLLLCAALWGGLASLLRL